MEKQSKDFKKIIIYLLYIVEFLFLGGACALYYYSRRKMGMMRYLVYLNRKLETIILTLDFKLILTILVVVLILGHIYDLFKRRKISCMLLGLEITLFLLLRKIVFSGIENSVFVVITGVMIIIHTLILKIRKEGLRKK